MQLVRVNLLVSQRARISLTLSHYHVRKLGERTTGRIKIGKGVPACAREKEMAADFERHICASGLKSGSGRLDCRRAESGVFRIVPIHGGWE